MTNRSRIRNRFATRTARTIHKVPARFRLRLEVLEDRLVPSLGMSSLVEGPAAGSGSDIVVTGGAWAATANAPWLHTSATGTGDGLAALTFDANTGATRTGTLTIAGQTLTVTQAGSSYVAADPLTTLANGAEITPSSAAAVFLPRGVAVDSAGNVYWSNLTPYYVEWNAATQTLSTNDLLIGNEGGGVAVDGAGNVYVADTQDDRIIEWNAATQKNSEFSAVGPQLDNAAFPVGSGGGRCQQPLHRGRGRQRDQGVGPDDADAQHPRLLWAE